MLNNFRTNDPYHISVNNEHNFRAFNFRIAHSIRKYFNNEYFVIYDLVVKNYCVHYVSFNMK